MTLASQLRAALCRLGALGVVLATVSSPGATGGPATAHGVAMNDPLAATVPVMRTVRLGFGPSAVLMMVMCLAPKANY